MVRADQRCDGKIIKEYSNLLTPWISLKDDQCKAYCLNDMGCTAATLADRGIDQISTCTTFSDCTNRYNSTLKDRFKTFEYVQGGHSIYMHGHGIGTGVRSDHGSGHGI